MGGKIKVSMNIDKVKWTEFRVKCLKEGKTATEVVESMITAHLGKDVKNKH